MPFTRECIEKALDAASDFCVECDEVLIEIDENKKPDVKRLKGLSWDVARSTYWLRSNTERPFRTSLEEE